MGISDRSRFSCVCGIAALLAGIMASAALSAPSVTSPTPADEAASAAPAPSEPGSSGFALTGFRSAHFGTDEAGVRAAILQDFGVPAASIQKSQNLADRTELLTVKVPDVLKEGGTAEVIYVLGYKTKKLTQVSIVWSTGTDKELTPERLVANGEALKSYFLAEGYKPESIASDTSLRDGILLFRGADAESHTTALMLRGTTTGATDKPKSFAANALLLVYLADPKAPDVFKIPTGKF